MATHEKKVKKNLTLPDETAEALRTIRREGSRDNTSEFVSALRAEGWTLESIAKALDITRERVRQLQDRCPNLEFAAEVAQARGWNIPPVPTRVVGYVPKGEPALKPDPDALKRLKELQPVAQGVRWNHKDGRAEAEEFVRILADEFKRGVSAYMLAKHLGVTPQAVRSRLARYGYIPVPTGGSEKYRQMYTPLKHR